MGLWDRIERAASGVGSAIGGILSGPAGGQLAQAAIGRLADEIAGGRGTAPPRGGRDPQIYAPPQPIGSPFQTTLPLAAPPILGSAVGTIADWALQGPLSDWLRGGGDVASQSNLALPGGAAAMQVPGQQSVSCPTLFRPSMSRTGGVTAARLVVVGHPVTGKPVFFGNLGTPIMFSGDVRRFRALKKVARSFESAAYGRRRTRRRR